MVKSSGSYTGSITYGNGVAQISRPVQVRVVLVLPANNFRVSATNATCIGSDNGSISVHANKADTYTATLSGGKSQEVKFSTDGKFNNLAPGKYNLCITLDSYAEYQQCFELTVTQPKDLSVYTVINKSSNTVDLMLDGSDFYNITINDKLYTTTGSITLPLSNGLNMSAVSTNNTCQRISKQVIDLSDNIIPYPNPVNDILNINLGNKKIVTASVSITSINGGTVLYSKMLLILTGYYR